MTETSGAKISCGGKRSSHRFQCAGVWTEKFGQVFILRQVQVKFDKLDILWAKFYFPMKMLKSWQLCQRAVYGVSVWLVNRIIHNGATNRRVQAPDQHEDHHIYGKHDSGTSSNPLAHSSVFLMYRFFIMGLSPWVFPIWSKQFRDGYATRQECVGSVVYFKATKLVLR